MLTNSASHFLICTILFAISAKVILADIDVKAGERLANELNYGYGPLSCTKRGNNVALDPID